MLERPKVVGGSGGYGVGIGGKLLKRSKVVGESVGYLKDKEEMNDKEGYGWRHVGHGEGYGRDGCQKVVRQGFS